MRRFSEDRTAPVTVDLDAQGGADPENTVGFSINFDTTQLAFISAVLGSGATGASLTINQSQAASGNIGFALAKSPGTGFPAGTHQILVITMLSLANGAAASTGISFSTLQSCGNSSPSEHRRCLQATRTGT
jgi:hypothetical protein